MESLFVDGPTGRQERLREEQPLTRIDGGPYIETRRCERSLPGSGRWS